MCLSVCVSVCVCGDYVTVCVSVYINFICVCVCMYVCERVRLPKREDKKEWHAVKIKRSGMQCSP